MNAAPAIAVIGAALVWGVLSIILSPCHLTSIPLLIGYLTKRQGTTIPRSFELSSIFSGGIFLTIGVIGYITSLFGRLMGDIGTAGNIIMAVILIIVGLYLFGALRFITPKGFEMKPLVRVEWLSALLLGMIFGFIVGPCTFAFMAPVLGVVFSNAGSRMGFSLLVLAAFGVGHCSIIVAAGTFYQSFARKIASEKSIKRIIIIKKLCGVLVLAGGIYLLADALRILL
jgi:cytochrome c-type biogenesis protein